jgi:hypothetical protein
MKFNQVLLGMGFAGIHLLNLNSFAQTTSRLPEVRVTAPSEISGQLQEEETVGENNQPEWTTQRRFSTTRIYVLAPWQFEFEQWWKGKYPRHDHPEHLFQSEIEIGLPYRVQLDLYENVERTKTGTFQHKGNQVEARWALGEWGKIPLNPTVYGEWKFNHNDADAFEVKLLLGQDLAPRWHWGLNLAYEKEIAGGRETEMALSQGISYTLVDQKFSVGAEMQIERTSGPGLHGVPAVEVLIGPSAQWRPRPNMHLDFVPLFGTTHDSPAVEAFIIFGIDFGGNGKGRYSPASLRSK